ncbi:hypothetical protein GUITHDRAFT_100194 [Guillardia theta CCMP2712]|uniref:Uncharacterized protein n=2 Tax=Guillardia theta TaxID=55529 RepID=L1K066_GUITC|nr:hypothetical protein GUITHDRAFT_100194 [Guillardia theta CCMP2712]EKX53944.1 hypothetical protein GUITHDRAFT_100194 [Guillardia theta CCMP2712]|mmetsp:Transcript_38190/g.120285  ORF Transcript_38190/g.120285 Transcript_38190/m.120285 type:complete len:285 (+) Transcript_38190:250-1104(+)|eukprot:XP_005840924.1 hypothetical protein GUITHDRAFT_100194 [Guillardia theta CCMP2712]
MAKSGLKRSVDTVEMLAARRSPRYNREKQTPKKRKSILDQSEWAAKPKQEIEPLQTINEASQCQAIETDLEDGDSNLPDNCAIGVPVVKGTAASYIEIGRERIEITLMKSVQSKNFAFVRYLLMAGWIPETGLPALCQFSITVHRSSMKQERLCVRNAWALHYAICCESFWCAAALIVAFPHLVLLPCVVSVEDGAEEEWTILQLTTYFCDLYREQGNGQVYEAYRSALDVLEAFLLQWAMVPFMEEETAQKRLGAAGDNPEELVNNLTTAARRIKNEFQHDSK